MAPAPPTTTTDALLWIQEALLARRYIVDPHFSKRMSDRNIAFRSVWYAIRNAHVCAAYVPDRGSLAGGTSWRVMGKDHQGAEISVGLEAFVDHLGRRVLLITVF
jgi:hypothetical protein